MEDDLTQLLADLGGPNSNEILERVYPELHAIAEKLVGSRRNAATLRPTALVHEAYLRLERKELAVADRDHFFALAARVMRHLLVDSERRRRKREGFGPTTLAMAGGKPNSKESSEVDLLDLDDALVELAARSTRQARVIELRFFGGLEIEDAARILGVSHATIERDWQAARAWLGARLSRRSD